MANSNSTSLDTSIDLATQTMADGEKAGWLILCGQLAPMAAIVVFFAVSLSNLVPHDFRQYHSIAH